MAALMDWLHSFRESRRLILVIVAIALLLDNMLLTTVVPIIPNYLWELKHPPNESKHLSTTISTAEFATEPTTLSSNIELLKDRPFTIVNDNICYRLDESEIKAIESLKANNSMTKYFNDYAKLTETTTLSKELQHENAEVKAISEMAKEEAVEVGLMFSSKAFVQLLTNPFIGPLTHRIGYSIPMFTGFVIMFLSTLIFAFGTSYSVLFIARALQGVGSSCSSVSGMGMLAERYPNDKERGNAMGLALGGLALGVLIGPPFGGVMSQYLGKTVPFLILAVLALGDGLLQLLVLRPAVVRSNEEAPSLKSLIKDPYIIIASGAITFANMGIGMLEPTLPMYMNKAMGASESEEGVIFLPASISYLIGTNLFGPLGHLIGRWLASLIGLFIIGLCLCCIPEAATEAELIPPMAGLGFAIGMVDSSMMPELGYLVDLRHSAVYGSVYSIGDVAFCLGFGIGPAIAGALQQSIGFRYMMFCIGFLNFLYAPMMYFLKSPPSKLEELQRLKPKTKDGSGSFRYSNFMNDDDFKEEYESENVPMSNGIVSTRNEFPQQKVSAAEPQLR